MESYFQKKDIYNISEGDKPMCFICYSDNSYLISNVCSCKNHIHLYCLLDCFEEYGDICRTCKNQMNLKFNKKNIIMFPSENIYIHPILGGYVLPKTDFEQLHYATAYLCVDKVKDILNNMSIERFKQYMKKADYYALHKKENGFLKILDYPYTKFYRNEHNGDFLDIEEMFKNKL
jgi:hypothetical protein